MEQAYVADETGYVHRLTPVASEGSESEDLYANDEPPVHDEDEFNDDDDQ